jgi:hypothetical protein
MSVIYKKKPTHESKDWATQMLLKLGSKLRFRSVSSF